MTSWLAFLWFALGLISFAVVMILMSIAVDVYRRHGRRRSRGR